jgi:hypothetical protein
MSKYIIITLFLLIGNSIYSQNLARINGQMVLKEKGIDGKISLSTGTFYYDTKIKKLIYNLIFPQKITWLAKDTLLYKIENGRVSQKIRNYAMPEFSIFHLALYGGLSDYGLNKSGYKISNTEKQANQVFITYSPDKSMKGLGKVVLSQKNGLLTGILFYNPSNKIINKQFYNKYITEKGISFPSEVVSISIKDNKESYQVTTYKKLTINDFKNNTNFDLKLSGIK